VVGQRSVQALLFERRSVLADCFTDHGGKENGLSDKAELTDTQHLSKMINLFDVYEKSWLSKSNLMTHLIVVLFLSSQ
jgi:hypothetical protein